MSGPPPVPDSLRARDPDHAELLLWYLQRERQHLLAALDGLSEHDVRRPMTPSATSLLGLVKHVATVEMGYLGECVGRPYPDPPSWADDLDDDAELWATAEESRDDLVGFYRDVWTHSDASVRALGLDAPAHVPWWPEARRDTTLGWLLVHQLDETAHHAGHADLVREALDGHRATLDDRDEDWWERHRDRVRAAADAHRPAPS